jgi:hypothetical protein
MNERMKEQKKESLNEGKNERNTDSLPWQHLSRRLRRSGMIVQGIM